MPIINFDFDRNRAPADAEGVLLGHTGSAYVNGQYLVTVGPRAYWVWKTHVGLCLSEREMNGYNDSDFFMTIWDEEKSEPREVMFATTRGWTYPAMGSSVDATPEVRAKYDAYVAAQRAVMRADRLSSSEITRRA